MPATGPSSPITVTNLTNGQAYRAKVRARNSVGWGPYSALSDAFTPQAGTTLPEPAWIATFDSDPGAADGANVLTFSSGKYGFGQTYKFGYNAILGAAITQIHPKYRTPGTNGSPNVTKRNGQAQALLGEIVIRGGDQTSSTDNSSRMELGLSVSNRTDLLAHYGDTVCFGGAWYWDPDNWVFENNPGQTIVSAQLPKGSDSVSTSPYLTFSNADQNALYLRANHAGPNIWSAGQTMDQLRGHLCRWMLRVYYQETVGTVELWFALDANPLVKQTMIAGGEVWTGTTMLSGEPNNTAKHRIGHYGDDPYGQAAPYNSTSVIHRMWLTGIEMLKSTDPANIWAVEPPKLSA